MKKRVRHRNEYIRRCLSVLREHSAGHGDGPDRRGSKNIGRMLLRGAELEKRKKHLLQNLQETVGKDAVNFGYSQVSPEQEELITDMALVVLHGWIDSASCKFKGTTVTVKEVGGKVKIQRTDTRKAEKSA